MSKKQLLDSQLKKEFPSDVSESMMVDIYNMVKGDKEKVKEIARGMGAQAEAEIKKDRDRKIGELTANFTDIDKRLIIKILEEQNWVVDNCIVPLFELNQKLQMEKRKQQEERLRQQRIKENEERINNARIFLHNAYKNIPKKTIEDILQNNNGDLDVAVDQLNKIIDIETKRAKMMKEKELETQMKIERETRIEKLKSRFENISQEEVIRALEANSWDVAKATEVLVKISMQRNVERLKTLFKEISENEIQYVLTAANGEITEAVKELNIRKLKLEEEHQKKSNTTKVEVPVQNQENAALMLSKHISDEVLKEIREELRQQPSPQRVIKEELENFLRENLRAGQAGLPGLYPGHAGGAPAAHKKDALVTDDDSGDEDNSSNNDKSKPVESSLLVSEIKDGEITLEISSTRPKVGDKVTVTIVAATYSSTDWIALYRANAGKTHKEYERYEWVPAPTDSNATVTFVVPNKFGRFEFRYFRGRSGYVHKATSPSFLVGPSVNLDVNREDNSKMEVSVKIQEVTNDVDSNNNSNNNNNNSKIKFDIGWVGLYFKSEKNNKLYLNYEYISRGEDIEGTAGKKLKFTLPKNGEYSVRYFPYRRYYETAAAEFCIADADSLEVEKVKDDEKSTKIRYSIHSVNPETDYTWVGLFFVDEEDNQKWRRYRYVQQKEGEIVFKTPLHAGNYEARLFANKSFAPIAVSKTAIVVDTTAL